MTETHNAFNEVEIVKELVRLMTKKISITIPISQVVYSNHKIFIINDNAHTSPTLSLHYSLHLPHYLPPSIKFWYSPHILWSEKNKLLPFHGLAHVQHQLHANFTIHQIHKYIKLVQTTKWTLHCLPQSYYESNSWKRALSTRQTTNILGGLILTHFNLKCNVENCM